MRGGGGIRFLITSTSTGSPKYHQIDRRGPDTVPNYTDTVTATCVDPVGISLVTPSDNLVLKRVNSSPL
jgi:hypothetical protein